MPSSRRSVHRVPALAVALVAIMVATTLTARAATVAGQDAPVAERGRPPLALQYTTTVQAGDWNRFGVVIQLRHRTEPTTRFALPRWAPGAYRLVNWHEGIANVTASVPDGTALEVRRLDDNTWEVANGEAGEFLFSYQVGAVTAVDTQGRPRLNNRHYLHSLGGLIDGPRTWMYVEGSAGTRVMADFDLPAGWVVATGLNPTFDPHTYSAEDYDWLIDCPTLVGSAGNIHRWTFTSWGVPFTVAYDAAGGEVSFDHEAFVASLKRICDYQASIFGGFPFAHFTFIYDNGGGGGLEHLRSTTIGGQASRLESDPEALWNISAHEFFHVWNVKRIRPYVLGPFDYQDVNRTQSLWISEGITDTYTTLTGIRAGFYDPETFYDVISGSIANWMSSPAQPYAAPARMSWTAWDARDRNPQGTISYYTQGEVLGLALDLIIRHETGNQRSLDDVMRILMNEHGGEFLEKPGFRTEDFISICSDVAGTDLYDFFEAHVLGTVKPDWATWYAYAGLRYQETEEIQPDLQFVASNADEGPYIRQLDRGGVPEEAGLRQGDRVQSVNGQRVTTSGEVANAVRGAGVGNRIRMVVQRGAEELTLQWSLPARAVLRISITEDPTADAGQLAIRRGFMNGGYAGGGGR